MKEESAVAEVYDRRKKNELGALRDAATGRTGLVYNF